MSDPAVISDAAMDGCHSHGNQSVLQVLRRISAEACAAALHVYALQSCDNFLLELRSVL